MAGKNVNTKRMPIEFGSRVPTPQRVAPSAERGGLRNFWITVVAGWLVLAAAGLLYARVKSIPLSAALPVLAAILIEYPFYLVPGFEAVRAWLEDRLRLLQLAALLTVSAVLPYLVFALGTGQFAWVSLLQLGALALVVSLWYVILPSSPVVDVSFLLLLAAVLLRKYFDPIYPPPVAALKGVSVLGHVTLVYLAAIVLLSVRRVRGVGFGFLPTRAEWVVGVRHFLYFLPIGFPLALWLGQIHLDHPNWLWWRLLGTFLGILWVVALSEDFFFWGLIYQWMGQWSGHRELSHFLTAVLFGLVHLPFRGFPNWRFALLAGVMGWFCGRAYTRAGSIRAAMVTHALVVALRSVVL